MLHHSTTLITPPGAEPVTLAEAKLYCKLDTTDEDTLVGDLITAARMSAEQYLRRSLITQTWKLSFDLSTANTPWWDGMQEGAISSLYGSMPRTIRLPKGPIQSISSVTTYDLNNTGTVYDASNYRLDSSRLVLNYGAIWPSSIRPQGGCEIVYVAGYGDASTVPKPIKTGILTHIASMYEQRGQCDDPLPVAVENNYFRYRIMDYQLG